VGTEVTITGQNFGADVSQNVVFFGTAMAHIISASSDSIIRINVPAGTTYGNISVTNLTTRLTGYAKQPFHLVFPSSPPIDDKSFVQELNFEIGTYPYDIEIGDLDGDGKSDLVVPLYYDKYISVLRNTSNSVISFDTSCFFMGNSPKDVTLSDLDGDGKLDIITVNNEDSSITVSRNISYPGAIQFEDAISYRTGQVPVGVAVGDIDGDGRNDLAVANYGENKISIFRNISNGPISFGPRIDITTPNPNYDVAIGDMNNDGKPELISLGFADIISIFPNTTSSGNISFDTPINLNTNGKPIAIKLADINNDGRLDILAVGYDPNKLSFFMHVQYDYLGFYGRRDILLDAQPYNISLGDIDGDSRVDIAIPSQHGDNYIYVLQNLTLPYDTVVLFSNPAVYIVGQSAPPSAVIGDLNMDGKPELSAVNYGSNSLTILKNIIPPAVGGEYLPDENTMLLMHLNEPGGLFVRDVSKYENNGRIWSKILPTSQGKFGNAKDFDKSIADYTVNIEIPASSSLTLRRNDFTVEFWVKTDVSGYYQRFIYRYSGASDYYWGIHTSEIGVPIMEICTPASWKTVAGNYQITDGRWHHICAIRKMANLYFYVDGGLQDYADISACGDIDINAGFLYIGGPGKENCPTGTIDEVRISNIARLPEDFYLQLPPKDLNASLYGYDVTLTWANGGGRAPFKEYKVYHSSTDSNSVSYIASTNNAYYIDSSISSGKHYYRVTAVDSTGFESAMSYAVSVNLGDDNPPVISNISVPYKMVEVQNGTIVSSLPVIYADADDAESGMNYFAVICKRWGERDSIQLQFPSYKGQYVTIPADMFFSQGSPKSVMFSIIAVDNEGNVKQTKWDFIGVHNRSPVFSPVQMPGADEFKDDPVRAYRMISVPYDLDDKRPVNILPQSLGDHRQDNMDYARWRFQVYMNSHYEDYEQHKDEQLFMPGNAFFLIVKESGRSLQVGSGRTVDPYSMAESGISLEPGWNLVGNPFNFPIASNWLNFRFYTGGYVGEWAYFSGRGQFAGGWELNPDTLRPWEGWAIWVSDWCDLLFIDPRMPYMEVKNLQRLSPNLKVSGLSKSNSVEWLLPIDVERVDNHRKSSGSVIGMAKDALKGYDNYDIHIPPFIAGKNAVVYFENEDGALIRDIKPVSSEGGVWNMKLLTGDEGAEVKITVPKNLQFPDAKFEAYLIDVDQRIVYDLKKMSEVVVNSGNGRRNFKVVVGKKSFIEENSDGIVLVPSEIKLYANYPNPFNSETVIRYSLSGEAELYKVLIRVYNMLGQEVATLVNKEQASGYYEVRWNASNQSAGVYFYVLEVTGGTKKFSEVKKMVYIK